MLVDDASTDGSLAVARETWIGFPWLTGTIVARGANHGLPAARNLAVEHARAPYVFILDADNVVYPHAFERLAERLDSDPDAAFAYGILEKFDADGPYDLVSCLAWDPKLLRSRQLHRRDVADPPVGVRSCGRLHHRPTTRRLGGPRPVVRVRGSRACAGRSFRRSWPATGPAGIR